MSETYRIAVLGGDGIGPEVTVEALKVLDAVAGKMGFRYDTREYPYGSEHYLDTGELMPEGIWDELRTYHAILLGAIGDPRVEVGKVEYAVIAGLRFKLDLFVNLRPIRLLSERVCPLAAADAGGRDASAGPGCSPWSTEPSSSSSTKRRSWWRVVWRT